MDERQHDVSQVTVVIDGLPYRVHGGVLAAVRIRSLPHPPIGPERDLWLEVQGGSDRFLVDQETVELTEGLRFFTAPQRIMAGSAGIRRDTSFGILDWLGGSFGD